MGGLLGNYVLIYHKQDWWLSIVNSDGCRLHGTYWDRIISGCRGLQPSEFASPTVQTGADSGRSVASRPARGIRLLPRGRRLHGALIAFQTEFVCIPRPVEQAASEQAKMEAPLPTVLDTALLFGTKATGHSFCIIPDWNDTTFGLPGPTSCDNSTVHSVYNPPPTQIPGCNPDCPIGSRTCIPCGASPIVLDLDRNGFDLTGAADGVFFDISGTGNLVQMGWTARGSDDGFLALPGTDGLVHSGKQLFGNFTAQPVSSAPNGFAALAVYDDPKNGGNGDGLIDSKDSIFEFLRIWVDTNHDGISQPEELHTLPSLGVNSISLSYKESRRTDQYGNVFRYRARVNEGNPQDLGPTAYDVFFVEITTTSKGILGGLIPGPIQRPTPSNGSLLTAIAWLRRPTDGRDLAQ